MKAESRGTVQVQIKSTWYVQFFCATLQLNTTTLASKSLSIHDSRQFQKTVMHGSSQSHDQTQLVSNTGTTFLSHHLFPCTTMIHETTKNQHKAAKLASVSDTMFPM